MSLPVTLIQGKYDSKGNTAALSLPVDKKMPDDLDHILITDEDKTIKAAMTWIQSSLGMKR